MRTNLSKPEGPLVGRGAEREGLLRMLRGEQRVVTITGPAGAGKTRLAIEVALALAGEGGFGEVWRVDLGEARDLAAVCDAVGQVIGAGSDPAARGSDPAARVGLALEARGDVLVVLDEMEGAVAVAAETIGRWVAAAPGVTFLVTSRQALAIGGEGVLELGPLTLPAADAVTPCEAIDLFVMCTQRARPAYTLTPEDAPFVAALVRELDGLPLAIELCAPRMAVMGARALLHRMTSRFDVLRKKGARPGDRHATLAAAIDASFSALSVDEQSALAQCAVFRGGFTLEAAEAVVELPSMPASPPPVTRAAVVLDVIETLRQRSLLFSAPAPGLPGEVRLGMLSSVRAFALEKLEPAARAAVLARHASHVVRAAEEHQRLLATKDGPEHRARILAERDNLVEVIERVLGRERVTARTAEPALRALLVLADLSPYDGPAETFARALDPVLSATRDSGADPALSARALFARGSLHLSRGDVPGGSRDLVQALSIARTLGDAGLEARATHALGGALALRGDLAGARDHLQRAVDSFARLGDASGGASSLVSLAALSARAGRPEEARALAERALSIHRAQKDPLGQAEDLRMLALFEADRGELDAASAHLAASLVAARDAGSRRAEALARGYQGFAAHLATRHDEARAAYEAASAALGEIGLVPAEAVFQGLLGILLRETGARGEAFTRLSLARDRLAAGGEADPHLALFSIHLAWLDLDVGRDGPAAASLARAAAVLGRAEYASISVLLELARAGIDPARDGGASGALEASGAPGAGALEASGALKASGAPGAAALEAARALAPASAHVRIALRCLSRAHADAAGAPSPSSPSSSPPPPPPPPPPPDALVIGPAALWFRPPHGAAVPLDRRRQLAKILDRLADERLARPGSALGWDALLAAAWPGERVLPEAAAHRVRVAVSTLRKLGLRDVLRTSEEGYLLAPETPATRAG